MKIETGDYSPATLEVDAIVAGVGEDRKLDESLAAINRGTDGLIERLLGQEEIATGKYSITPILAPRGIAARQLVVVGLGGERAGSDAGLAFRAAGAAAKFLAGKRRDSVAYFLDLPPVWAGIAGSMAGGVGQDRHRAEKKLFAPSRILWHRAGEGDVQRGQQVGSAILCVKDLVNGPPNFIYPQTLAARCQELGDKFGFEVEVWDEQRLHAERCNALLAVAAGSERPPRLIIMRYRGGPKDQPPLGWVGKGVTFDSGGLSLKPTESMADMKMDMAGAATVIGAIQAVAALRLPVNVVGVIGCVENLISGKAYKLGDVIIARNGKTIEVLNTDAEGRVVLADALDVAVQEGCTRLVDLATLTGACMVALGRYVAGVMSNDQAWCDQVLAAARGCGEDVWQLPMYPEFDEQIKSPVADIKNIGDGRWGGAITAAKFLEQFVGATPWCHFDIAGPAFFEKPQPWADAGASGSFVSTLVELAVRTGEPRAKA
jgi:leucyl aminopeptidase